MNRNIKTWQERTGNHNWRHGSEKHAMAEIADLRAYIAELEARTPAAPVVAEGLVLVPVIPTEKMMGILQWFDRGSPAQIAEGWARVLAEIAAHPVAGSPAEAEPEYHDGLNVEEVLRAKRKARAAEPMPASEARATAYDVLGLIAATTTDADTAKIAADNMKQFSPIAAPVPASEAASVDECRRTCNICYDEVGQPWPCAKQKAATKSLAAPAAPTDAK